MKNERLETAEAILANCTRCPLSETRNNIVFGVGNPHARIMFIGEGPGKNEDLQGEPFVGAAGKLLNSLLEEAGLSRDEIYIANIVKCRPPQNRDPRPDEIEACTPFLREQIRAIRPDILVTLGNFATKFVLKTDRGITGLRGQIYVTGRFRVLPTYHPAAAIYDQSKKAALVNDFALLARMLEVDAQRAAQAAEATDVVEAAPGAQAQVAEATGAAGTAPSAPTPVVAGTAPSAPTPVVASAAPAAATSPVAKEGSDA